MSVVNQGLLHLAVLHQSWLEASQEHCKVKGYYSKMESSGKAALDLRRVNGQSW